jgi:hypothetical protein
VLTGTVVEDLVLNNFCLVSDNGLKNQILYCFTDLIEKLPHGLTEYRKCFSNKVSVSAKALVTRLLCKALPVVSLAYFD